MTLPLRFIIDGYLIDMSRSEVTGKAGSIKVEPKVLQVLLLLAQNAQQVVSHQQIMEQVWQGSEVVPNALQRCIARLRKVLDDDAKSPRIIATHPKIGYRLMVDVQWQQEQPKQRAVINNPRELKGRWKWLALVVLIMTLGLFFAVFTTSLELKIKSIKTITHTDSFESEVSYSPNGQYIVFNRQTQSCYSHIWAKNLKTGIESRLSEQAGFYRDTRFTFDGRSIIFTQQKNCDQKAREFEPQSANCWQINSLDFAASLSSPQPAAVRYQCQNQSISRPIALPNHQYAFLQTEHGNSGLIHYNALNQQSDILFAPSALSIYSYDYSPVQSQYAVIGFNPDSEHVLSILNEQGRVLQQHIVTLQKTILPLAQFEIRYSNEGDALLAVNDGTLYHLNLNGELSEYKPLLQNIISVDKHPKNAQVIAITGYKDTDIANVPIYTEHNTPIQSGINQSVQPYKSFARTKSAEKSAKFQPFSDLIAFISERSGNDEVWLWDGAQATQLSDFANNSRIEQLTWSPDGKQIAVVSNGLLKLIDLDGNTQSFNAPVLLEKVAGWHQNSSLLVTATAANARALWALDLKTLQFTPLPIEGVINTWSTSHTLYFSHLNGKVFRVSLPIDSQAPEHMSALNGKSLVLSQNKFYSYDPTSRYLSMYNLEGELIKQIRPLKPFAWKLSDVKGQHMLLEQVIEVNQDIIELELSYDH
ncbi:winged helix-turn-helix domain-containing protein [Pseudoalteromonas luteoviolacea]|uniref:winged helix-turn-helix domain-containing protein n=1 Tax=Pseudoalteromonas luteoviolacea TaxID=43657 RepID=UPI001B36864F|nr:winged helix-turn-helix domain-containing protein [Pseudoalteromonas luteoviolacea]MBQ4810048.1 winged helix-turn-helix domain-containing protein [Pseudoalteromonas luteoviolacea]